MAVRSAVLKPAVLVVTDWNRATSARFPTGRSLNSNRKKKMAGRTQSARDQVMMTLLCIRYLEK